jgi:hypothetical protein
VLFGRSISFTVFGFVVYEEAHWLLVVATFFIVYGLAGVLFARAMHQRNTFRQAHKSPEQPVRAFAIIASRVMGAVVLLAGVVFALMWLLAQRA